MLYFYIVFSPTYWIMKLRILLRGVGLISQVRGKDSEAEVVVEDNGPGFPPDVCSRALERFVKG